MKSVTIVALQPMLARRDHEANFATIAGMVDRTTAERRVDLIVLPEAFDGVVPEADSRGESQEIALAGRRFVADLARTAGTVVVGGSIAQVGNDGRIRNVCVVADRAGEIVGEYAKRKLFASEADSRVPGRSTGVFEVGGLRIGVLICADLWYPELARELCGRADLLCVPAKSIVPSADFVDYARTLWWSMAITRSYENVLPVVVADWCERAHEMGYTAGVASVSDPAGRPDVARLQRRIDRGAEGSLIVEIDLDAVEEIRHYRRAVGLLTNDASDE